MGLLVIDYRSDKSLEFLELFELRVIFLVEIKINDKIILIEIQAKLRKLNST